MTDGGALGESKLAAAAQGPATLVGPSPAQLAMAGVWLALTTLLLGVLAFRLLTHIDRVHWWVPVALIAGIAAADFASGLVHWAADTWGRADLPVIGRRLLLPFRIHHLDPDALARRGFLDTNGDVAAVVAPVLLALVWLPLESAWGQATAVFGLGMGLMGAMTNQIHQWAHVPSPPGAVRALQRGGFLLRPNDHASHHGRPFDGHYCITTGWCNGPLESAAFFRRLEEAITWMTGAIPRHDERTSFHQ